MSVCVLRGFGTWYDTVRFLHPDIQLSANATRFNWRQLRSPWFALKVSSRGVRLWFFFVQILRLFGCQPIPSLGVSRMSHPGWVLLDWVDASGIIRCKRYCLDSRIRLSLFTTCIRRWVYHPLAKPIESTCYYFEGKPDAYQNLFLSDVFCTKAWLYQPKTFLSAINLLLKLSINCLKVNHWTH